MIGLKNVKKFLKKLALGIFWETGENRPGNFIFSGPPGAGKTHVARLMGDILFLLGVLKRRHVTERKAGDFLQAADPVAALNDAVELARRGILFIDEAHQLADSQRGLQVLRELVPIVENPEIRADTCFILAGYNREMQNLLRVDNGLERRFPANHRIRFTDYTANELRRLLEMFARDRGQIPGADYLDRSEAALEAYLRRRPENFGNAGFIRDVYLPDSIAARTERLNRIHGGGREIAERSAVNSVSDAVKRTLTAEDVPARFCRFALPDARPGETGDAFARLHSELFGKDDLTAFAESFRQSDSGAVFADAAGSGLMHYSVTGPIGCGRKTAVRLIADALCQLELLETGHVRFVSKGDLEAEYVGQTAQKTRRIIEETAGGTLAVLSPSSMLSTGRDNSFGPEALSAILGGMSAHMADTSFVFIDSPEGMEAFFKQFPSVRSLLGGEFALDDLSPDHMHRLFSLKTGPAFAFDEELSGILPDFFLNWVSRKGGLGEQSRAWANGSELDRLIDHLRRSWEKQNGETDLSGSAPRRILTRAMFPDALQTYMKRTHSEARTALEELDAMTGLGRVKSAVRAIERRIRLNPDPAGVAPGLYCYLGNPGAGKTTVARLMGSILRATGVLTQGHVIERRAQDLIADPAALDEAVKLAKNGILFIDEAHELAMYSGGMNTVHRLLNILEDVAVTRCTAIILAGYPAEMQRLLESDSGLNSRFGGENSQIVFDDYTPDELLRILTVMAAKADRMPEIGASAPLDCTPEYLNASRRIFEQICAHSDPKFGNARGVRNYLHDSLDRMAERADTGSGQIRQLPLTEADIPRKYARLLSAESAPSSKISVRDVSVESPGGLTSETIARYEQSVVLLEVYRGGQFAGSGTGSIISPDGVILTNRHVAAVDGEIVAYLRIPGLPGGKPLKFRCTRMEPMFADCDMALLKMDGTGFPFLPLRGPGEDIGSDEKTLVIGYSLGNIINGRNSDTLAPTRYAGSIASIQQLPDGIQRCYIDSRGTKGNSGSPVFSMKDGRIIGVFTGSVKPADEEINFFYPIRYFWERFATAEAQEVSHD